MPKLAPKTNAAPTEPQESLREKILKPYVFHGVELHDEGQENVPGDCPFCKREGKFSVNANTGLAKCWVCGVGSANGGMNPLSFMRNLWDASDKATTDYTALVADRGFLDADAPTQWGAAKSIVDGEWLLPARDAKGNVCQVYRWAGRPKRTLYPTPGLGHGMFWAVAPDKQTVWITEGFWDGAAAWELLRQVKQTGNGLQTTASEESSLAADTSVTGIPGCNSFKAEWASLFDGKDVVLTFDSDHPKLHCKPCRKAHSRVLHSVCPTCKGELTGPEVAPAGYMGVKRVAGMLAGHAKSIRYVKWGMGGYDPNLPCGTDLRDVLRKGKTLAERLPLLGELLGKIEPIPDDWGVKQSINGHSHSAEIEPLPCTSWKECHSAWIKALELRPSLVDAIHVGLSVCLSTNQVGESQLMLQMIGDAGCLHGDTPIYDPVDGTNKTVAHRQKMGTAFHVWSKEGDGRVTVRAALPPKKFTVEPMYRVTMQSGKQITVTANHRFWNGRDYDTLRHVVSALREYGAYRLPSISEPYLSVRMQDVPHWTQTIQDSQWHCWTCFDPCGERLLSATRSALSAFPSLGDVLARILQSLRMDAPSLSRKHTRAYRPFARPSKNSCVPSVTNTQQAWGLSREGEDTSEQSQSCIQDAYHTRSPKDLIDTGEQFPPAFLPTTCADATPLAHSGSGSGLLRTAQCQASLRQPRKNAPLCTVLESCELSQNSAPSALQAPVQMVGDTPCIVWGEDMVIKVEPAGESAYYDFHVPETNNYWAEGVFHHNSAKTRILDAIRVSKTAYLLEHLTGFHSGWKDGSGNDFSLIARINGKTLITPEGDVMMSNPKAPELMSQMRRVFDGSSKSEYKNKTEEENKEHRGLRTPWIIGGTPALLSFNQSRVGDRFIKIIIENPDEKGKQAILRKVALRAMESVLQSVNGTAGSILSREMLFAYQMTGGYVDFLRDNAESLLQRVEIPDKELFGLRCAQMGDLVSHLRARPDTTKADEKHETKEMPTRLTEQFVRLGVCLAVVSSSFRIDAEVMRILRKVAMDTASGKTLDWLRQFRAKDVEDVTKGQEETGCGSAQLSIVFHEEEIHVKRYLKFLKKIKVVENFKSTNSAKETRWRLTAKVKELWKEVMGDI